MPGMRNTMHEFKAGSLHSGSKGGPVVKSRKQAIAIGLSENRKAGLPTPPTKKTPGKLDFKTKLKRPKPSGLY